MKRPPRLDTLPLSLRRSGAVPLWSQISTGLRVAIATGRLGPGARLPSTRAFARQLAVSRNTVSAAYDDLAARGLLRGRTGAGSFIARPARPLTRLERWFEDASGNRLGLAPLP
jgi:DNA-binding GntR family transcriptional regulator